MKSIQKQAMVYSYQIGKSPLNYKMNNTGVNPLTGYPVLKRWLNSHSSTLTLLGYARRIV
jgi:hypothetical protein